MNIVKHVTLVILESLVNYLNLVFLILLNDYRQRNQIKTGIKIDIIKMLEGIMEG